MVNKDSFNRIMFMNQTPESQFPIEISVTEVKQRLDSGDIVPVSYTHLTLPTILLV